MPSRASQLWAHYVVLDSNSKPLAGDLTVVNGVSSTHTLGWSKDGSKAACTNNIVSANHLEVGNGLYKILLTAAETDCNGGGLYGTSTTSGAVIVPVSYTFELLPAVAAGAEGGLPVCGADGGLTDAQAADVADAVDDSVTLNKIDGRLPRSPAAKGDAMTLAEV
jgi:hypothetical protein